MDVPRHRASCFSAFHRPIPLLASIVPWTLRWSLRALARSDQTPARTRRRFFWNPIFSDRGDASYPHCANANPVLLTVAQYANSPSSTSGSSCYGLSALDFGTVEGHSGYGQATSRLQLSDALVTAELRRDEAKMTYTDQCTLGAVRARRGPRACGVSRRLRPGPPSVEKDPNSSERLPAAQGRPLAPFPSSPLPFVACANGRLQRSWRASGEQGRFGTPAERQTGPDSPHPNPGHGWPKTFAGPRLHEVRLGKLSWNGSCSRQRPHPACRPGMVARLNRRRLSLVEAARRLR